MRASDRSIRFWLALLALSAALPLLAVLVWMFVSEIRREQHEAREAALQLASATAGSLRGLHVESSALLERMAARPGIRAVDPDRCDSLFAIVDFFPQYADLFLFDGEGNLVCSADPDPGDRKVSAAARSWIAEQIRAGRLSWELPLLRPVDEQWVSVLAIDVTGGPEARRGVLALVQLPSVHGPLEPGATVTVVDSEGILLVRKGGPGPESGLNVRAAEVTRIVLAEKEGRKEAIGVDGISRQYGFTHLPELGWYVYVGIPTWELMQPVRAMFVRGAAVGGVVILTAMLFAILLSRSIERPIGALAEAANEVASEGFTERVPMEGPREVATLGSAFNEMVARRSTAEAQLLDSERSLKALSDRLMTVQEAERMRIAREIHDDLGQSLTALKMDMVGLLRADVRDPERAALRERIARTLDRTVEAVQRIAAELRPGALDDLGLLAAIEAEAQLFEERTGIECELSLEPMPDLLEKPAETALYRIIQEAMTNVARHSNASRVEIRLRARPDQVLLEIRDDGRGIRPAEIADSGSLGLLGMRERAAAVGGSVHLEGIAGRGTILTVRIPTVATVPEILP